MARKTFESALARLENITRELEAGELGLEQSLKKFEEGIALAEFCNRKLEEARTRVELLLVQDDGQTIEAAPFDSDADGD